jgi:hypothetical protein
MFSVYSCCPSFRAKRLVRREKEREGERMGGDGVACMGVTTKASVSLPRH